MKIKVLLVDDEPEFTKALSDRLTLRGFSLLEENNGEDALKKIKEEAVDVVLLDIEMPGLSGMETLKRIKELKPLIQVIIMTGHATVERAIEGMKNGAHDFLMKPVDIEILINKLNEAWRVKNGHEERIRKAEINSIVNKRGW